MKEYEFHHIGIPTTEVREGESYHPDWKIYSSGYDNEFRIQWHRFEKDSPFHPLMKKVAHVAYKVPDLEKALEGRKVIMEPHEPFPGFRSAMIEFEGAPVEFIETNYTHEDLVAMKQKKES